MVKKGIITACICIGISTLVVGCGSSGTSFDDEVAREQVVENADKAKDKATSEIENANEAVEDQDEQIKNQAKDTTEGIDKKSAGKFEQGIDSIDEKMDMDMNTSELSWYYFYKAYYWLREITPALIGLCWFGAILMYIVSVGNQGRRAFAIFGLGIGIPAVLFLIRYLVPWFIDFFAK